MASPQKKIKHHVPSATSQLVRPLQSPLALFLNLPRELRDLIYHDCDLDWNVIGNAMTVFEDYMFDFAKEYGEYEFARRPIRQKKLKDDRLPTLSTPNILQICRQITGEALQVLRNTPLALGPPVSFVARNHWPLRITAFISGPTLQHVRHLELTPDARGRAWCNPMDRLYAGFDPNDDPGLDFTRSPFVESEANELHEYLWGIRNALRERSALQTLTVRFGMHHPFEVREMYYEQVFRQLVKHLPLLDVRLPEDDEVAEGLICDLMTSTESKLSDRFKDSGWPTW